MKRTVAFVLLLVLVAHLAGFYVYFGFRLMDIRREMLTRVRQEHPEKLQRLVLSTAAYEAALVEEDEMKYQGRMFDIAYTESSGQHVIVYALHDEQEDDLLAFLDGVVKTASKDKKPVPGSLLALLGLTALTAVPLQLSVTPLTESPSTHWCQAHEHPVFDILAPPPRG